MLYLNSVHQRSVSEHISLKFVTKYVQIQHCNGLSQYKNIRRPGGKIIAQTKQPSYYIYKHKNLYNGKVYIGKTYKPPEVRWGDGGNYRTSKEFYKDIIEYGWFDGFTHEVLYSGLSSEEAIIKECEEIVKHNSVNMGYNSSYCASMKYISPELKEEIKKLRVKKTTSGRKIASTHHPLHQYKIFNPITDFDELYQRSNSESKGVKYFCRVPNQFIRCKIQSDYGLSRIFYVVYYLIDQYRSYGDCSWITIKKIYENCKYIETRRKSKLFHQIIDCLNFLNDNGMIRVFTDLDSITYDTAIEIKIIPENFDFPDNWSKLPAPIFDKIMTSTSKFNKENLLLAFLYVNSYIINRPKNPDGTEKIHNPSSMPEAFYRNLHVMASDISMSRDTVTNCMQELVSLGILKKKVVGSVKRDNTPPQNVPNIYVINKDNYKQEIEWALDKIKEIYQVDSFGKPCGKEL